MYSGSYISKTQPCLWRQHRRESGSWQESSTRDECSQQTHLPWARRTTLEHGGLSTKSFGSLNSKNWTNPIHSEKVSEAESSSSGKVAVIWVSSRKRALRIATINIGTSWNACPWLYLFFLLIFMLYLVDMLRTDTCDSATVRWKW